MKNAVASRAASPSRAVIEAIATREGVEPIGLETPLFEAVDPDALDALVGTGTPRPDGSPLSVQFTYHGYDVTVSSQGDVTVSKAA